MNESIAPPKILVVDDVFGRRVNGLHKDRLNLCGKYLLRDVTENGATSGNDLLLEVPEPVADVVFCRGQKPVQALIGDLVENDLSGTLATVRLGWCDPINKGHSPWAMVLLDLCFYTGVVTEESNKVAEGMPAGRPGDDSLTSYFGLRLLDAIHTEFPQIPIVILSSKPRESVSLEFSRRGALGFIARDDKHGAEALRRALWIHGLMPDRAGEITGQSLEILVALREARRATGHRQNVLIRGERGSGKELMARYLHRVSRSRSKSPFVTVNSALLSPNLFASELFGIEPRTATGVDGKTGLIQLADKGDLFLDEIADMPLEVQAAMLRVLQEKEITPVGGRHPRAVDVRFLSATNSKLEQLEGRFRSDLLDRLRLGGTIWLPSLQERRQDIPLLARQFVKEAETQLGDAKSRSITKEALEELTNRSWPGNVRELRSEIFSAVSRHPDVEYLVPDHFEPNDAGESSVARRKDAHVTSPVAAGSENGREFARPLASLMQLMNKFVFSADGVAEWAGQFHELQRTERYLMARYLEAALDATKRRTPDSPGGQIQIHPAIKLLTGDSTMTASKAADLVKRILGPLNEELEGTLRLAYETALRLRPKSIR